MSKYILAHHGIDGQKWGQRNGPPYPLDYEDHSAEEKRSNPKSVIGSSNKYVGTKIQNKKSNTVVTKKTEKKSSRELSQSEKIDQVLGFDLSKYSFKPDGWNREVNAKRQFEMFGATVNNLIEQYGKDGAIEYLQKEYGFSKEDAEKVVNNLNSIWKKKEIKEDSSKEKKTKEKTSKQSSGKKSTGSQKQASSQTDKNAVDMSKVESVAKEDYNYYKQKYSTLSKKEKASLLKDKKIKTAKDYAMYMTKEGLKSQYTSLTDADVDPIVQRISAEDKDTTSKSDKKTSKKTSDKKSDKATAKKESSSKSSETKEATSKSAVIAHHGVEGMHWGVRRYQNEDGSLTEAGRKRYLKDQEKALKTDMKWIAKNEKKVYGKAYKESKKELDEYSGLLLQKYGLKKNGKLPAAYVNAFNQGMAALMNEKVADVTSPSGRAVKFIAKRGEMGVHTALADQGYDISQVKNGVWESGRIAYRKTGVTKIDVSDD